VLYCLHRVAQVWNRRSLRSGRNPVRAMAASVKLQTTVSLLSSPGFQLELPKNPPCPVFLWLLSHLRRERNKPRIGTPIALGTYGGFRLPMFGFEKERLLAVTLDETAIAKKRVLSGGPRRINHRKRRFFL